MKIKLTAAILASSVALFFAPAYASHCDDSDITIENNTLTALEVIEVKANDHSRIEGISPGHIIDAKHSQSMKVSSGWGSDGNASGEIVLLTHKGVELHLTYQLIDEDKLFGGTCHVEIADVALTSTRDAPTILTNRQDGEPATVIYFINRN